MRIGYRVHWVITIPEAQARFNERKPMKAFIQGLEHP